MEKVPAEATPVVAAAIMPETCPVFLSKKVKVKVSIPPPEAHPEIVMDAGLMLWKNSKLTNQNPGHFAALIWTGTGSVTTQAPSMLPRNWDSSCIG